MLRKKHRRKSLGHIIKEKVLKPDRKTIFIKIKLTNSISSKKKKKFKASVMGIREMGKGVCHQV